MQALLSVCYPQAKRDMATQWCSIIVMHSSGDRQKQARWLQSLKISRWFVSACSRKNTHGFAECTRLCQGKSTPPLPYKTALSLLLLTPEVLSEDKKNYRRDALSNTLGQFWTISSSHCKHPRRLDYPAHLQCVPSASSFAADTRPLKRGVLCSITDRITLPAPGRTQWEQ